MKSTLSGLAWVVLYLVSCLVPLVLAAGQPRPPGRPFLVEFSVALGFVGLSILTLQFALIARFKAVAAPFGIDALLQYHVQITFVALTFAFAHPVLLFVADSKYLHLLNLLTAPWRARFAFTSVAALLVLVGLCVWRRALHLSYEVCLVGALDALAQPAWGQNSDLPSPGRAASITMMVLPASLTPRRVRS
jgi:predicted ferric reductase